MQALEPQKMDMKLEWEGLVISIQPRIRLARSFDERSHSYLGYSLKIDGSVDGDRKEFWIGIGKAAQLKHDFQVGVQVKGKALPIADSRVETVDLYKASSLKVIVVSEPKVVGSPPWHGIPPVLEIYRERGHRRLSSRTYKAKCTSCIWGCNMPVVMTVDHWNPQQKRYRFETFCYGPKSCSFYNAGQTRKVPGRSGMSWEEEDWVDDDATRHRGLDD
jgi:hypothetical protein